MTALFRLLVLVAVLGAVSFAQQSLGDIARQTRSQRKSARVITNEDLPHADRPAAPAADKLTDRETGRQDADKEASGDKSPAEALKELEKRYLSRFTQEKQSFELLSRELNVLQRENQIKTAEYYADAGTRLRDPKAFSETTRKSADDIAARQKTLEESRQKLENLKEEARHAGLPMQLFEE